MMEAESGRSAEPRAERSSSDRMDDVAEAKEGNAVRAGLRGGGEGKARKVRPAAENQLAIALSRRSATRRFRTGLAKRRTFDRERRFRPGRVGAPGQGGQRGCALGVQRGEGVTRAR